MDALAKHECKMAISKLFLLQSKEMQQEMTVAFYKTQLGEKYPLILEKSFAPFLYTIVNDLKRGKTKRTVKRLQREIAQETVAPLPVASSPSIATPIGLCHAGGIDLSKKRVPAQHQQEEEEEKDGAPSPFLLKENGTDPELLRQFLLYKEQGLPTLSLGLQRMQEVEEIEMDIALCENDVASDEECIARATEKVQTALKRSLLSQVGDEKDLSATLIKKNAALQDQLALAQETIRLLNQKLLLTEAELIQVKARFGVSPLPELTREHKAAITRAKGTASLMDQTSFSIPASTAVSSETFNAQRFNFVLPQ